MLLYLLLIIVLILLVWILQPRLDSDFRILIPTEGGFKVKESGGYLRPTFVLASESESTVSKGEHSPNVAPRVWSFPQIIGAYGMNGRLGIPNAGTGVKIAIVDAFTYPNLRSDLLFWLTSNGMSSAAATTLTNRINVTTFGKRGDSGWQGEQALDLQTIVALCPGATIGLFQSLDDTDVSLMSAVQAAVTWGASVVSMSWGADFGNYPRKMATYDAYFTSRPNVIFLASSGDSGDQAPELSWPAMSKSVVGVGGTSLLTVAPLSQAAWNASGGGSSTGVVNNIQAVVTKKKTRQIPDLSSLADPYTGVRIYSNRRWGVYGGTSLAAPIVAAFIAYANSQRLLARKALLTQTQVFTLIYRGQDLLDITTGASYFSASSGYDPVTGMGTPGLLFVTSLINL